MKVTNIAMGSALIGLMGCAATGPTVGEAPCSTQVRSVAELDTAIDTARAGQIICLMPGTYDAALSNNKTIKISEKNGQAGKPITLRGQAGVVITNSGSEPGIHVNKSSYIELDQLAIQDTTRAIMLDESTRVSMSRLHVNRTSQEAIHFRTNSTHNVLINSKISHVGVNTRHGHPALKRFAEAIYIGTAKSNWLKAMGNAQTPDASNNNCVSGNTVGPQVAAEAIDVKEGTTQTYILNNSFDLSGISGHNFADSALDLKGSHIYVGNNRFTNADSSYIADLLRVQSGKDVPISTPGKINGKITPDAIQTHIVPTQPDVGSGSNILIWNNHADLKSSGRPSGYSQGMLLRIDDESGKPETKGSRLCKNNSVGPDDLLSNIPATDCPDIPSIKACPQVLMQAK